MSTLAQVAPAPDAETVRRLLALLHVDEQEDAA